jgi:hypothetical protein
MRDEIRDAVEDIDAILGQGYAKAHPELIGAYMQSVAIEDAADTIAQALNNIRTDHPLMGETGIASALGEIAEGLRTITEGRQVP